MQTTVYILLWYTRSMWLLSICPMLMLAHSECMATTTTLELPNQQYLSQGKWYNCYMQINPANLCSISECMVLYYWPERIHPKVPQHCEQYLILVRCGALTCAGHTGSLIRSSVVAWDTCTLSQSSLSSLTVRWTHHTLLITQTLRVGAYRTL